MPLVEFDGPGVYFKVAPESVREKSPIAPHDLPVGMWAHFADMTDALLTTCNLGRINEDQLDLALGLLHGMANVCNPTAKATLDGLRETTGQGPLTKHDRSEENGGSTT